MTAIWVPALEGAADAWPTLGPQVVDFIQSNLVFGPGDLLGEPMRLSPAQQAFLYRCYEVHPEHHARAGRRRFRRAGLSLRKGLAKTELAALVAAAELHPEGPVRCAGFDGAGQPTTRAVRDPYIPMVAYTEEQTEDLAYGALRTILAESRIADHFDIGLERIMVRHAPGEAKALASSPNALDGARTTFEHFDETHRFILPRLKNSHRTMLANLPKRFAADPWALETTTAYVPAERSVAEETAEYARAVISGHVQDPRLLWMHRQASEGHDLDTPEGLRAAVLEASGSDASWSDIDAIVEQWQDPNADPDYLVRVWLNIPVVGANTAFDLSEWDSMIGAQPEVGASIALGFDGSRTSDATALVACDIVSGTLHVLRAWERPEGPRGDNWRVPDNEVDAEVAAAFELFEIERMYCDPRWWETWIAEWQGRYGDKVVIDWHTNRVRPMSAACLAFNTALNQKEVSHTGQELLMRHLGAAYRHPENFTDDEGRPMWTIRKERPDSPRKIDAGMAAILAFEARRDAIADGALERATQPDWVVY